MSGLVALTGAQAAIAVAPHTTTTALWTPTLAPLPTAPLPNGGTPAAEQLNSTSCSSVSFCVAVGVVSDSTDGVVYDGSVFPLIETYSGGVWTPTVAPLPSNAYYITGNAGLNSVSCAPDGSVCAAVGTYLDNASHNGGYQNALLETLSNGTWTMTEGSLPDGPDSTGDVNGYSVSCGGAGMCMAVGAGYSIKHDINQSLVWLLSGGTWTLQSGIPMPTSSAGPNGNPFQVPRAVSCPDPTDCVVVGNYGYTTSIGFILTWSSGTWSVQDTPLPKNGDATPPNVDLHVLVTVDCVDAADCVAGGVYFDKSDTNEFPLFVTLKSGKWSASEAPVPPDSSDPVASDITGISCPAVDACVADGNYWLPPGLTYGVETAMILTQSKTGWTSTAAPVPVASSVRTTNAKAHGKTKALLQGITCVNTSFCRAVGVDGKHALIERRGKR